MMGATMKTWQLKWRWKEKRERERRHKIYENADCRMSLEKFIVIFLITQWEQEEGDCEFGETFDDDDDGEAESERAQK